MLFAYIYRHIFSEASRAFFNTQKRVFAWEKALKFILFLHGKKKFADFSRFYFTTAHAVTVFMFLEQ